MLQRVSRVVVVATDSACTMVVGFSPLLSVIDIARLLIFWRSRLLISWRPHLLIGWSPHLLITWPSPAHVDEGLSNVTAVTSSAPEIVRADFDMVSTEPDVLAAEAQEVQTTLPHEVVEMKAESAGAALPDTVQDDADAVPHFDAPHVDDEPSPAQSENRYGYVIISAELGC